MTMKKVLVAVFIGVILVVCLGAKGNIQVDESENYDSDMVTMYSEDGRTQDVPADEVEENKEVGWYDNFTDVITKLWADDGRSIIVYKADKDDYLDAGWKENRSQVVSKIYNKDTGEEKEVFKSEVQSYLDSGWKRGTGDVDPDAPMVALTFDDGPSGELTPKLLDALEENGARATFFCLGQSIDKVKGSDEIIRRMKEMGCEVGSHTQDHKQLTSLSEDQVKQQINQTKDSIRDITGEDPSVMRPPYGAHNETVDKNAGAPVILWSKDSTDWRLKNADAIYEKTLSEVEDGDIILLHDIHDFSVEAAIRLIPKLQDEGYQLVTVTEMIEAKVGNIEDGKTYTDMWPSTVKKLTGSN